jgi:hypothetical protein
MTIDRRHVGFRLPSRQVVVDADRVRRFIEAIGEEDAGTPIANAPPTYLKVIEGEGNSSREIVTALGVDLRRVMHVEQEFEYGVPVRGGDCVSVDRVVTDIYDRKDGALEFIVVESTLHNSSGVFVGRSRQTILVRNSLVLGDA